MPSALLRISGRIGLAALLCAFAIAAALAQTADPPGRVAALSDIEGSVAFAPAGETEWTQAERNRPITVGDRLWTDEGARAELQLGTAALQLDSRTFLEVTALEQDVLQAAVHDGSVNARVRELGSGDEFEIDTPQLALRAVAPGDMRVDVDAERGLTRVAVRQGMVDVAGANGETQRLATGQEVVYEGADLQTVAGVPPVPEDTFDAWAQARNGAADQAVASRYIPPDVVGADALGTYGTWSQDPNYGAVWFPPVMSADWAPYRYGHWDWIADWGWTWVDDAPWGFAPFHYGRWARIGPRWAWVPGHLGRKPVWSPALVGFFGNGADVGWYPLAPGETWRPVFPASPGYVERANRDVRPTVHGGGMHFFQSRPDAVTAMRAQDFSRGAPVQSAWSRLTGEAARAPLTALPAPAQGTNRIARPAPLRVAPPQVQLGTARLSDRNANRPGALPPTQVPGVAGAPRPRPMMPVPGAPAMRPPVTPTPPVPAWVQRFQGTQVRPPVAPQVVPQVAPQVAPHAPAPMGPPGLREPQPNALQPPPPRTWEDLRQRGLRDQQ